MEQLFNIEKVHIPTYEEMEKDRERSVGKLKSALPIMRLYSINGYFFNKEELSDYLRENREGQFLIIDYIDCFDGRNNAFKITYPDGQVVVKVALNKNLYEVFKSRGVEIDLEPKLVRNLN